MLEPLGGNAYWKPPHNMAVNFAIFGTNLWYFTLFPLYWKSNGYRPDLGSFTIRPIWRSFSDGSLGYNTLTDGVIKKLAATINKAKSIPDSVKEDLRVMETTWGIDIPDAIKNKLIQDSLKMAKRRWGVDHVRTPNTLVPLDGSKPRNLRANE